ncbi:MAG: 4Fe-4S dicluster domain-containing protein [Desulfobacterales bacterium]|nr:4Fe-4S dicluster domain-containing protein [Desulfobacterales bacterium]
MKINRKIIKIDDELCNGCGECVSTCAESALILVDGKARVVEDRLCDGLGACIGECPTGALEIIEREADDFDEKAVHERLSEIKGGQTAVDPPCGCPSVQMRSFVPSGPCVQPKMPAGSSAANSELSHWPIQIRLMSPAAPYLKGADLLVAADCVPVAYADFHRDFLKGKVVLLGCPKLDDNAADIQKLTDIFKTADIKSITTVDMEVPCCQGLPVVVKRALKNAGKDIPFENVIISIQGKILAVEK